MPTTPMLGKIALEQVESIQIDGEEALAQHAVPGLEGDFLQRLGRRASRVTLKGTLVGPKSRDNVETLRRAFRAAQPLDFVTDIATATKAGRVLIEEVGIRELAGKPERYEYTLTVREFVEQPKPDASAGTRAVNDQVQRDAVALNAEQVSAATSALAQAE
jgi:hypothetical protein